MKERKPVRNFISNIRAGKDIDIYLSVILLFAVPSLYLFFPNFMENKLNLVIIAVFGAILVSNLANKSLLEKLSGSYDTELISSTNEAGLEMYYPKRRDNNFEEIIENAKVKFDSIGTSLPDIAHERCWKSLREGLVAKSNLKVRILLLNPYSSLAIEKKHSNIYSDGKYNIIEQIERSINQFKFIGEDLLERNIDISSRYDVRLYSLIPTVSCVFNDDILDIAFYDENEHASITPAWKFKKNDSNRGLYNYYQDNFERVWNDKKTISIFTDKTLVKEQKRLFQNVR